MICELCNGTTLKKKVKKQHWLHDKLYIVENVTAEVCLECGERYYHATVLDEIDYFLKTEHKVKERIDIEVVTL
jgi:YgiT-type zinc finger domain-containing protein